jgi:hypothetical protein
MKGLVLLTFVVAATSICSARWPQATIVMPVSYGRLVGPRCLAYNADNNAIYSGGQYSGRAVVGCSPNPSGIATANGYERGTYYAAELGQPERSPYCLSRGGFANVDTSASMLRYELPYLDPRGSYQLRAIIYHEGRDSLCANVRCDSGDLVQVRAAPHVPDTIWVPVPKRLYRGSGKIILELARTRGEYLALAELRFFQVEDRNRGHDGAQSLEVPGVPRNRLLGCAPNPINGTATVSYELGQSGPVALAVHDVSGRLMRRLETGNRSSGRHEANWDVTDDHGRRMPAGVYFVRFSAGGQASSCRITLVR